jgi:hypothetical protein
VSSSKTSWHEEERPSVMWPRLTPVSSPVGSGASAALTRASARWSLDAAGTSAVSPRSSCSLRARSAWSMRAPNVSVCSDPLAYPRRSVASVRSRVSSVGLTRPL